MDIHFDLIIKSHSKSENNAREVILNEGDFCKSVNEALDTIDNPQVSVFENQPLSLNLTSSLMPCYFQTSLLDVIAEELFNPLERMDNGFLFLANTGERYLYNINDDCYPMLIPGKFLIKVICGGKEYFSIIEIMPKNLNETQLEELRNEVESIAFELAKDFRLNSLETSKNENDKYDEQKITFLVNNFEKIIRNVKKIIEFPHTEIKKNYLIQIANRKLRTDSKIIRNIQKTPNKSRGNLTFQNNLEYDTFYNQNLKFLLNKITKFIQSQMQYLNKNIQKTKEFKENDRLKYNRKTSDIDQSLYQINMFLEKLSVLQQTLNSLQQQNWFQEVTTISKLKQIGKFVTKNYYSDFYKIYIFLKQENTKEQVNYLSQYGFYWRETSYLYEIWGLFEIIKIFKYSSLGFVNMHSLNNENEITEEFGKIFILEFNNNIKIKIFFDQIIPDKNNIDSIYTLQSNNRPDLRIDVYKDNKYIQTMIGDFKYRKLALNKIEYQRNNLFKQLNAYSNIKLSSTTLDNISVSRLFCLIPTPNVCTPLRNLQTMFITLAPREDNTQIEKFLIDSVNSILEK